MKQILQPEQISHQCSPLKSKRECINFVKITMFRNLTRNFSTHFETYSFVCVVLQVAMGYSHTLVIARHESQQDEERLKKLPEYNPRVL